MCKKHKHVHAYSRLRVVIKVRSKWHWEQFGSRVWDMIWLHFKGLNSAKAAALQSSADSRTFSCVRSCECAKGEERGGNCWTGFIWETCAHLHMGDHWKNCNFTFFLQIIHIFFQYGKPTNYRKSHVISHDFTWKYYFIVFFWHLSFQKNFTVKYSKKNTEKDCKYTIKTYNFTLKNYF